MATRIEQPPTQIANLLESNWLNQLNQFNHGLLWKRFPLSLH